MDISNSNIIPVMYTDAGFSALADPSDKAETAGGSIWPRLASFFANKGIPVRIANVAVDSTSITEWVDGAAEDYYSRITAVDTALGGIEATICIGGETDSSNSMSQATVETNLGSMITSLSTDFGCRNYVVDFPIGDATGGTVTIRNGIRAAFDAVISSNSSAYAGGDLSTIDIDTTTDASNDGLHIKLTADLNTAAEIVFNAINGSSIDLDLGDITDGVHRVLFCDSGSGYLVDAKDVTFSSGTATTTLEVLVGTEIQYSSFNPANNGVGGDGGMGIAVTYA